MLKDRSGSMTVESSLIIPMIIFLVITFVAILIFTFNFNLELLKVNNKGIITNEQASVIVDFNLRGKRFLTSYSYDKPLISTRKLQIILSLIIDTIEFYYRGLING